MEKYIGVSRLQALFLVNEIFRKISKQIDEIKRKTDSILWNNKQLIKSLKKRVWKLKKFTKEIPEDWYNNPQDFLSKIPRNITNLVCSIMEKETNKNKEFSDWLIKLEKNKNISYEVVEKKIKECSIKIIFTETFNFVLSKMEEKDRIKFIDTYADKLSCQLDEASIGYLLENTDSLKEIPRIVLEKDVVIGKFFIDKFKKKYPYTNSLETLEIMYIYLLICTDEEEISTLLKEQKVLNMNISKAKVIIEIMKKKFWETKK